MPVLYRCTIQIFYIIPAVKSISGNKNIPNYSSLQLEIARVELRQLNGQLRLALERVVSKRGTTRILLHNALFRAEDGFAVRRTASARAVFARGRYALLLSSLLFKIIILNAFFIILTLFLVCIKLQYQHCSAQKHGGSRGRGKREQLRRADRAYRDGVDGTRKHAQ